MAMRAILLGTNAVITAEVWATCQRSVQHGTHRFSAVTTTCVTVPLLRAARSQEPKCAKRNHETHVSTPAARYTKHENVALRTELPFGPANRAQSLFAAWGSLLARQLAMCPPPLPRPRTKRAAETSSSKRTKRKQLTVRLWARSHADS